MFGGKRAGKTTLLAQMMGVIDAELDAVGMNTRISQATVGHFARARRGLSNLVTAVHQGEKGSAVGVAPTDQAEGVRRYGVGIDNSDGVTAATIAFSDYSGEFLESLAKTEEAETKVRETFSRANALLVAVNSPTLMAAGDDPEWRNLHKYSNFPDVLNNVLTEYNAVPNLILFCPIKAERWLHEDASGKNLLEAVKRGYRQPLKTLESKHPSSTVWLLPVETVGSIEFDKFEVAGGPGAPLTIENSLEVFRPTLGDVNQKPRYNDQPLRHLMGYLLKNVNYEELAEEYSEGDTFESFLKSAVNSVASWWTSAGLPEFDVVREVVDEWGGREEYQAAAKKIAANASTSPPIYKLS